MRSQLKISSIVLVLLFAGSHLVGGAEQHSGRQRMTETAAGAVNPSLAVGFDQERKKTPLVKEPSVRPEQALKNRGRRTPLMEAAASGSLDGVRRLLAEGAAVDDKDAVGHSALSFAAWRGHSQVAKALIAAGADVNTSTNAGITPLMFAAGMGEADCVEVLLSAGANVNAKSKFDGYSALMFQSLANLGDVWRILIDRGADVNAKADSGETVLMLEAQRGSVPAVEALIAHGADI